MSNFLVETTLFHQRPAARIANGIVEVIVLSGGGHIASIQLLKNPCNPLWLPPWPTVDPGLRRIHNASRGDNEEENNLLACISGHNLCLDVFGGHSPGELSSGLAAHGEAGLLSWDFSGFTKNEDQLVVTMEALLYRSCLKVTRSILLKTGSASVEVKEEVINLTQFQRVIGKAQHASLGSDFLQEGCNFSCNADRGRTFPTPDQGPLAYEADREFCYPDIPLHDGRTADWTRFPRQEGMGGISTLRIRQSDPYGWFTAYNPNKRLAVAYAWERKAYPWLVTWEEHYSRKKSPWNGRTLARGMEFSSYAFPTSRIENVKRNQMMGVPCFEWLDAAASNKSSYVIHLAEVADVEAKLEIVVDGDSLVDAASGMRMPAPGKS